MRIRTDLDCHQRTQHAFHSRIILSLSALLVGMAGCGGSDEAVQSQPVIEVPPGGDAGYEDVSVDGEPVGADGDNPPDGDMPGQEAGLDASTGAAAALLEIYPLDIWAQVLPAAGHELVVTIDGQPAAVTMGQVPTVALTQPGDVKISLAAPEHESLSIVVRHTLQGASVLPSSAAKGHGLSLSHEMREVDGAEVPVHSVYLGLRHKWFSAQARPARRGNQLTFLMDGEEAWGSVAEDLGGATDSILVASWWWQSDFELVRDVTQHAYLSPAQRWSNTILGILESRPAYKRVLVGQFWGQDSILSFMTSDAKLKGYAEAPNDKFDFMGQANETQGVFWFDPSPFLFGDRVRSTFAETGSRSFDDEQECESTLPQRSVDLTEWPISIDVEHASYHQKFMVIDHDLAYIGGMNLKEVDWDTSEHKPFEVRRMEYDATAAEREQVAAKNALPDNGPRKDYMVRIDGPSAQDAADVFQTRWSHQLSNGAEYAQYNTPFTVQRGIPERANGKQVQVTTTLPEPFWEHGIAETWFNAVAQAKSFIFIEDQYFRMPMLNDAIIARMQQVPDLVLVVITKPINEWTDPGCPWSYKSHELFRSTFPTRYMLLQLRSFDTVVTWGIDETESRYQDIDVHSKMLIVDDKFMSVGSCNKNNRGMVYEGEMNVAVLDPDWVRNARRRLLANMLPVGTAATDSVATWWDQLKNAAVANDAVYDNWEAEGFDISLDGAPLPVAYKPKGFVHSLDFGPVSDCFMESVGPDMTLTGGPLPPK